MDVTATVAIGALVLTVALFAVERWLVRGDRKRERRSAAVARVLQAVEDTVHLQLRPLILRMWKRPDVDFLLLAQRLHHELDGEEAVVASWLVRQTQYMMRESSETRALQIGVRMAIELVNWEKGRRDLDWFKTELERDPVETPFAVPRSVQWRKSIRTGVSIFLTAAVAGVGAGAARELLWSPRPIAAPQSASRLGNFPHTEK